MSKPHVIEAWEKDYDRPGEYEGEAGFYECRRGQMPAASREVDDVEFRQQLEAFDPDAEIIYNPRRETWSVYRVKHYGAVPTDDLLLWEFDLEHDPGFWVLNELRRRSIVRPGETSPDPKIAARQFLKGLVESQRIRDERRNAEWRQFMTDIRRQMEIFLVRNRRSDVSTRHPTQKKKHADVRSDAQRMRVPHSFDERTGLILPAVS